MNIGNYWSPGWGPIRHVVVGMLLCMLVAISLTSFWSTQAESAQLQVSALRSRLMSASASALSSKISVIQPADPWIDVIPDATERDVRITALLRSAAKYHLVVGRFDQQLLVVGDGIERVQVTAEWRGTYAALRQYIEENLQTDRALGLDQLRLTRASPEGAEIDAQTVWSFHQRRARVAKGSR